jgi:YEATS domain-containing protein 4
VSYDLTLGLAVEGPPFEVRETGWGGFQIDVRLHFHPMAFEKPQWRTHYLQLEPYGTEQERKLQMERKSVISETVDFIEFNEPTEGLWDALTDDNQWDYLKKSAGRGKGGRAGKNKVDEDEPIRFAVLPEHPTPGNPYSLEMEQQVVDMLEGADRELKEEIEKLAEKRKELEARLSELQASGDAVVKKK